MKKKLLSAILPMVLLASTVTIPVSAVPAETENHDESIIGNILYENGSDMIYRTKADPETGRAFESEDDIFSYFTNSFSDMCSDIDRGIDWFFSGEYFVSGVSRHVSLQDPDDASRGFMKSFVSSLAQKK